MVSVNNLKVDSLYISDKSNEEKKNCPYFKSKPQVLWMCKNKVIRYQTYFTKWNTKTVNTEQL